MKKGGSLKPLLAIIALAILLRAPGIPWGIINHDYFEPDEGQHAGIAKNFINTFDRNCIKDSEVTFQMNARGFGTQLALLGYPFLKIFNFPSDSLFILGRILSLFYSLLLIILLYIISFTITGNKRIALLSSLLMSIFDLNITYSHYATPDIAQVFWDYLSVFSIFLLYKNQRSSNGMHDVMTRASGWLIILVALSISMALSFRFDIVPLLLLLLTMGFLLFKDKIPLKDSLYTMVIIIILLCGFFYLSVGFNFSLKDFFISKHILTHENYEIVPHNNHYLYNPMLYFLAILSGTSIPAVIIFVPSLVLLFIKDKEGDLGKFILLSSFFIFFSFIILWAADAPFVRRANIFLPYIAIVAGYGLINFIDSGASKKKKIFRTCLVSLVVVYTALNSLISQYAFLTDTRYKASKYLNEHLSSHALIAYSMYAKVGSMPDGIPLKKFNDHVDFIVLHEAYYGRYWKYFTTPFKLPRCCDEVYHCDYNDCILIQSLLSNKSDYRLIKSFEVSHVLPERLLFKYLFGTYETFLGDVLIYKKSSVGSAFLESKKVKAQYMYQVREVIPKFNLGVV